MIFFPPSLPPSLPPFLLPSLSFLCTKRQPKANLSSFSAITSIIRGGGGGGEKSDGPSSSQIESMCSGTFSKGRGITQGGVASQCTFSDVIGLCSGVFPSAPSTRVAMATSSEDDDDDVMPTLKKKSKTRQQDKR